MSTTPYQVRYNVQRWVPGQGLSDDSLPLDREGRPLPQPESPDYHYPGDYAGLIDSIVAVADVESGKEVSLRHMEAKDHPVVVLDLTEEQRQGAASKTLKVQNGTLVPVTFGDRLGAVVALLRERNADPEQWERDEIARVEAEEAENETRRVDYDTALEQYMVLVADFPIELHKWSLDPVGIPPAHPEQPKALRLIEVAESSFDVAVRQLAQTLPGMLTKTGTGMYWVKKAPTIHNDTQSGAVSGQTVNLTTGGLGADAFIGGYILNTTRSELRSIVSHGAGDAVLEGSLTNWQAGDTLEVYDAWSTIQASCDQLFTDQGASYFTAAQYVRIFAGTYDENVVIHGSLRPARNAGLVIEGDPADSRANVHVAPSAGTYSILMDHALSFPNSVIRHLTFDGTPTAAHVAGGTSALNVVDCAFDTAVTGINGYYVAGAEDCSFVAASGDSTFIRAHYGGTSVARRCSFKAQDTASWVAVATGARGACVVVSCTFSTLKTGVSGADGSQIAQNTFYNCATGVATSAARRLTLVNNIFSGCAVNLQTTSGWPQITAAAVGPVATLRNNCFHNYTTFAYDGLTNKTYAEFIAFGECDAAGNLDATDPLMTDPANDDFSLTSSSPCIRRAPHAGVFYDVNGDPYADDRVDIGAVSSGTSSIAPVPTNVEASTGVITGTFTVGGAPNVRARLANRAGLPQEEKQRLGTGDIVFSAVPAGDYTVIAWGCDAAGNPIGEPSVISIVTVSSTSSVVGYGTLQRTPHTIRIVRPTRNRDATTGSSSLDYASPVSDRQVEGFLSTSGGTVSRGAEGEVIGFDAVWFTNDSDFEVDDQAIVAIPGLSGNFLVIGTEPKFDLDGDFDHNEVLLSKDNKR